MRVRNVASLDRRAPIRRPKRRFVIFCEGGNTEPSYFGALRRRPESSLVQIQTIGAAGVPYTVAEKAVNFAKDNGLCGHGKPRNSFEEEDEVWAVFDRDEHPRHEEAVKLCEDNRIGLGRSNPCFEVWLILHFEEFDKPDGRRAVQKHLAKLSSKYDPDKGKCPDCDALMEHLDDAEKRAEGQLLRRTKEGGRHDPPSTTVFQLTRAIRSVAKRPDNVT